MAGHDSRGIMVSALIRPEQEDSRRSNRDRQYPFSFRQVGGFAMGTTHVNDFRGITHSSPAVLTDGEQQYAAEIDAQTTETVELDD
jgi:hypothetical protein